MPSFNDKIILLLIFFYSVLKLQQMHIDFQFISQCFFLFVRLLSVVKCLKIQKPGRILSTNFNFNISMVIWSNRKFRIGNSKSKCEFICYSIRTEWNILMWFESYSFGMIEWFCCNKRISITFMIAIKYV